MNAYVGSSFLALKGESLKAFLLRAVRAEIQAQLSASPGRRTKLPIVESTEASYDVSPERLANILEQEDRESLT